MKCPICDGMGTSNTCVNGTFKPCTFCDGTGEVMTNDIKIRCDDCKFQENCVDYGWQDCKKFTQKATEPMTNEEWFCTLSTEEKAEKLTDFSFWLVPNYPTEDKREQVRKNIVKWLKEIHK